MCILGGAKVVPFYSTTNGALVALDTKLEEEAFLVYGLPDVICLGNFKRDWLVADRAVYFWLLELHC